MMDVRLVAPFSMGVFAGRGSGKSVFTKNLLLSDLIAPPIAKVVWIYKSWQAELFKELSEGKFEIEFLSDIPEPELIKADLVVIDDFMSEASNSLAVQSLFTRGRHLGVSVVYLAQNLFHGGKYSRDLSLNMDYIVLFKNARDATQIAHFARQMYPSKSKFLVEAHKDATNEGYGHLLLDLRPNTDESLRVRGNIFNEFQSVYIPKLL